MVTYEQEDVLIRRHIQAQLIGAVVFTARYYA